MQPFYYSYIFSLSCAHHFMKSLFACTHTDVAAVDDLITLSMLGALDEEAPDEDDEEGEDDWRLNHEN